MEFYTLDRGFHRQNVIDVFESAIWTERYYGDSEVEIVVPANWEIGQILTYGTFLSMDASKEVMILDTIDAHGGTIKVSGQSLLANLNNRFFRASAEHKDQHAVFTDTSWGALLWKVISSMCLSTSDYLNGTIPTGIPDPSTLAISNLTQGSLDTETTGDVSVAVSYGPLYDAAKEIATTYGIGMRITLEDVTESSYSLEFSDYRGVDRSGLQNVNPVIRFSSQTDSFNDTKELQSIKDYKTNVYSFATKNPSNLATVPGVAIANPDLREWDLRAFLEFADDISTNMVGGDPDKLLEVLNQRAQKALAKHKAVNVVDGEISPLNQFKYRVDYDLGDTIEVQGTMGFIQPSRITEYIWSQDANGEKAYPTVVALE